MKLEYTITLEDLREAMKPVTPPGNFSNPVLSLVVWMAAAIAVLFDSLPHESMSLPAGSFTTTKASDPSAQNLWLDISPSLCITSYLLISVIRAGWEQNRTKAAGQRPRMALVPLVGLVWLIPAIWPHLAVYWRPSDSNKLCAAFTPWMFYFGILKYILARRRARSVEQIWAKSISLHRPNRLDVSAAEISSDDGVVAHRYRWSHFKRYAETENLLLLTTEDGVSIFLAKRAVPDEESMNQMKMLIQDNIAEGSFKPQARAFPVVLPEQ